MTRPVGETQSRIERDEFERGHLPEGAVPVEPRPAATTVVARPGEGGPFEILLLKRPLASRFAAGAYVFPGGVLDPSDSDPFWAGVLPEIRNLPQDGRAAAVAALRELFEETGILLLDGDIPEMPAVSDARAALLADERTFADMVREWSGAFRRLRMAYFARWVTPRLLARRYDALFFLVAMPDRSAEVTITDEHDEVAWVAVDEALERFTKGELPMMFPTWQTIQRLSRFEGLEDAMRHLSASDVSSIEPVLEVDGARVRPRMPDED